MPTIHLVISGRVQGVNFRAAAREVATRLSLTGWVRNTPEGKVELTASGPESALGELIAWCRNGPPAARVTGVTTERLPEAPFTGFVIRRF